MSEPQRHDIFEDENGTRVAVRQVFPPNALGISYVEYKNLADSNLRFLPLAEFMNGFKWVDNFGSTDLFTKRMSRQSSEALPNPPEVQAKSDLEGAESPAEVQIETGENDAEGVRSATPTRAQ
jgi:hypothetical protein